MSLLMPLIAFVILLLAAGMLYMGMSLLSAGKRSAKARGLGPYACGEDLPTHMIQPDYGQFYPFAFFFTILHVVALTVTTVPIASVSAAWVSIVIIASVYVLGAVVGLTILYRK